MHLTLNAMVSAVIPRLKSGMVVIQQAKGLRVFPAMQSIVMFQLIPNDTIQCYFYANSI